MSSFSTRHARAVLGVLSLGLASAFPARSASGQDVVSQTARYDTAAITTLRRENSAELAPVIVVDPKTKTAVVRLTNHGTAPLAVDLSLRFYTVGTDTAHNLIAPVDSAANPHSLVPWVTGLPEHLTIAPGATDTVVLTVKPPASLAPGEYWARLAAHSPTVQRPVAALVTALTNQGEGNPLALVQQPATANLTVEMESQARLVYRQGTPNAHLTATAPTATWIPANGVVRVCTELGNTGSAGAMINGRFSVLLPSGKDTLAQPVNFEIPPNVTGTSFAPCFGFVAFSLSPGNYTVALALDANRTDIPAALRVPFSATRVTASLVVPPGSSTVGPPEPPRARPLPANGVPVIELLPANGSLESQLAREAKTAATEGKVALVEIGASWCGPCQAFLRALGDTSMVAALKNARVVRIDFDRWGASFLGNTHYTFPASLPNFFTLRADGTQGTTFDINARWGALAQQYGTLDERTMAPSFKTFIAEEQAKK